MYRTCVGCVSVTTGGQGGLEARGWVAGGGGTTRSQVFGGRGWGILNRSYLP